MNVFEERGIITLDLHGVRHHEVNEITHDFILRYQDKLPLIIICGNSMRMIDLVCECCKDQDYEYSLPRFGIVRVERI